MQPAGILMTVSMQFDECENDALAAAAAASSCARWLLRSAAWSRAHFELGHFLQKKPEVTSIFMAAKKGDVPLVSPEELAGTFVGNGCVCSPECIRLKVSPACCGGICVLKYCGGCPIPCVCQYMMPCGDKCYTDCDDEGYWTPDRNTIEGKCGYGFKRVEEGGTGQAPASEMER